MATSKALDRPYGPGWLKLEDQRGQVVIEDAQIVFRNFAGDEKRFNAKGDRNFCVIIPPDIAEMMIQDGWNVKQLRARDDDTPGDFYIQVSVGFKQRPPNLFLISSKGRVRVGQHQCEVLDWVDIQRADMIINPSKWDVNGKTGIKAYVKTLAITINEDYLELKYADVPELDPGEPSQQEMLQLPPGEDQTPNDEELDIVEGEIVGEE